MTKLNIYLILLLSAIACKSKNNTISTLKESNVKIIELDSIQNIYIYYCTSENNTDVFRILTTKDISSCKSKITLKETYKMKLEDLSSPIYSPNITGFWFNKTRIPIKDKNNRSSLMYTSENIHGLCYKK